MLALWLIGHQRPTLMIFSFGRSSSALCVCASLLSLLEVSRMVSFMLDDVSLMVPVRTVWPNFLPEVVVEREAVCPRDLEVPPIDVDLDVVPLDVAAMGLNCLGLELVVLSSLTVRPVLGVTGLSPPLPPLIVEEGGGPDMATLSKQIPDTVTFSQGVWCCC